jgi:hypothetical protein
MLTTVTKQPALNPTNSNSQTLDIDTNAHPSVDALTSHTSVNQPNVNTAIPQHVQKSFLSYIVSTHTKPQPAQFLQKNLAPSNQQSMNIVIFNGKTNQ